MGTVRVMRLELVFLIVFSGSPLCSGWTIDAYALNLVPTKDSFVKFKMMKQALPSVMKMSLDQKAENEKKANEVPQPVILPFVYPWSPISHMMKRSMESETELPAAPSNKLHIPWKMELYSPMLRGR